MAFSAAIATIDLAALARNLALVRSRIAPPCDILAVVKANAYGHGAVPIATALAADGITRFGVANLAEGLELRAAGLTQDVVLLGGFFTEQIADIVGARLTPVIHRRELIAPLTASIPSSLRPYPVHLKVDTGMTRIGLDPDQVLPALSEIGRSGVLRVDGLMTHLSDADNDDAGYTTRQVSRFQAVIKSIEAAGFTIPCLHAANTAGILRHRDSHFTMVRPGLMLYGYGAGPADAGIQPILTLSTKVLQVRRVAPGQAVSYNAQFTTARPSRLAVLPIGYADGYSRALSNAGAVLLGGRRAPIVGRVCMDLTIVDATDIPGVQAGDEAILIGRQGGEVITAVDVARWANTIAYEVISTIGARVPRRYRTEDV